MRVDASWGREKILCNLCHNPSISSQRAKILSGCNQNSLLFFWLSAEQSEAALGNLWLFLKFALFESQYRRAFAVKLSCCEMLFNEGIGGNYTAQIVPAMPEEAST